MNKIRFEKLLGQNQLYLLGTNTPKLHFYVSLHVPTYIKEWRYGIFEFDPTKFRAMTEHDAVGYIKKCKDSMRRELDRV